MTDIPQYADQFKSARLSRQNGVLEVVLHTNGGPLQWDLNVHRELPRLFDHIGQDKANRIVILTGTGDHFSGPRVKPDQPVLFTSRPSFEDADRIVSEGKALITNFLDIGVPIISAINGPAWRHAEIPLLADIVLASDQACFQDSAHFAGGLVPGDGMHIVMPALLGMNRARYFLLMGQTIQAEEARQLGLVAEVLPPDQLLTRAREIADYLAAKPSHLLRLTRAVLLEQIRRQTCDLLGFGLHAEFFALSYAGDETPNQDRLAR